MGNCEPDRNTVSKTFMISYNQAYRLTLEHIQVLTAEDVALLSAVDRITADNLIGRVYSPSVDVSLKDGYAVHSKDIAMACEDTPVSLCVIGTVVAGGSWHRKIGSGEAVRILSGAPIPDGVDAVIAEEFTQLSGEMLLVTNDAQPGRNILARSSDVCEGALLVEKGIRINPPMVGLFAAAGFQSIPVVRLPRVAILANWG